MVFPIEFMKVMCLKSKETLACATFLRQERNGRPANDFINSLVYNIFMSTAFFYREKERRDTKIYELQYDSIVHKAMEPNNVCINIERYKHT